MLMEVIMTNPIIERYRERNEGILERAKRGWRHVAIARMYKMKVGAVSMVISRARHKADNHKEEDREC